MSELSDNLFNHGYTRPSQLPGYENLNAAEKKMLVDAFAELYGDESSVAGMPGRTVGGLIRDRSDMFQRGDWEPPKATREGKSAKAKKGSATTMIGAGPTSAEVEETTGLPAGGLAAAGIVGLLVGIATRGKGGMIKNAVSRITSKMGFGQKAQSAAATAAKAVEKAEKGKIGEFVSKHPWLTGIGGAVTAHAGVSAFSDMYQKASGQSPEQLALKKQLRDQSKMQQAEDYVAASQASTIPIDRAKILNDRYAEAQERRLSEQMAFQERMGDRVQNAFSVPRAVAAQTLTPPPSSFLELAGAVTRNAAATMPTQEAFQG